MDDDTEIDWERVGVNSSRSGMVRESFSEKPKLGLRRDKTGPVWQEGGTGVPGTGTSKCGDEPSHMGKRSK